MNHDPCSILLSWLCLLLQKDKEIYHIPIIKHIQLHLTWHASKPFYEILPHPFPTPWPNSKASASHQLAQFRCQRCQAHIPSSDVNSRVWNLRYVDFECRSDEIVWHSPPIRVAVIMMKISNFSEILRTRNHINWWKPTDCFLKGKGRPQRLRLFLKGSTKVYLFEPQTS